MIRNLIITSFASLALLFPSHGKVQTEPHIPYQVKPPKMVVIKDVVPEPQSEAVAVPVAQVVTYTAPVVNTVISGCGDNFYANFIYMHESGCNASAINPSSGAGGVGQALPFSKTGCSLGDYACQNIWFTGYANSTYGGWAGAYSFWIAHSWW